MKSFLDPDEVLLDSHNLPSFNEQQFEGQIERPINKRTFFLLGFGFLLVGLIFLGRTFQLQIGNGAALALRSEQNTLRRIPIFAERGLVTDRLGQNLIWNDHGRHYLAEPGLAHLLGYLSQPREAELQDGSAQPGELVGRDGAEKIYNDDLRGEPGIKIEEVDVAGQVRSDYLLQPPRPGRNLSLSIDARIQTKLFHFINDLVAAGKFTGGSGVIMDSTTGEILALTNLPEYDSNIMTASEDHQRINAWLNDKNHPFLNRAAAGVYTPGSIVKPIMAIAALTEKIITPEKQILSTGQLVVPNPFFPSQPSIFKDWKPLGWMDLRHAIAMSSDIYFYSIGGGAPGQVGLGIDRIDRYARLFGLGEDPGGPFPGEAIGTVPTPAWKAANFQGASWLLGDTYHTVIGQYGFQVTPLQMVRALAAIANGGHLVKPNILAIGRGETPAWNPISEVNPDAIKIVREGMRLGVQEGTASGLNVPGVAIAGKTGTAQLGTAKELVNSWVGGFFPYDNPRYAFVLVMERGKQTNLIGATFVMRQLFDWMIVNTPEYFKS